MDRQRISRMCSVWLAVALLFAVAPPLRAGTPTAQDGDAPPTDADLANTQCAIGEEHFLPADYYYCIAEQAYGSQHYERAQKFFKTAAGWASKPAQYVLAVMALNGDHQRVNRPLALAWLTLASERSSSDYRGAYDSLYKAASADERKAAEQLLVAMRPSYGDNTAAVRAEKRYATSMAELTRLSNSGALYCMAGASTLARPNVDPTACPPAQAVAKAVDTAAATVFEGWQGHVQVGPLEQVPTPEGKGTSN